MLAACTADTAAPLEATTPNQSPAIYGDDSRTDLYALPEDLPLGDIARQSVVALIPSDLMDVTDPNDVVVFGPTLGEVEALCAGEPFAQQPAIGFCSGVLIDSDLVLTAGHCMDEGLCSVTRFVFDYYFSSPGELASISREDVYGCRQIVARELSANSNPNQPPAFPDYAIVQLDRPVSSRRRPLDVTDNRLGRGASVRMIGYPSGLPAKVDLGGQVIAPRSSRRDYFSATVDAFGGSSGSPVFDDSDALIGLLIAGQEDYTLNAEANCQVNATYNQTDTTGEFVQYATVAIDGLCAAGWPSALHCGEDGVCGDRRCSGDETSFNCASDCRSPVCGDRACGEGEVVSCPADCGPPAIWECSAIWYGTEDGCDCECGTPDPDCDGPTGDVVFRCENNQRCIEDRCVDVLEGDDEGCVAATPTLLLLLLRRRRRA